MSYVNLTPVAEISFARKGARRDIPAIPLNTLRQPLSALDEAFNYVGVGEGRGVTKLLCFAGGYLVEDPSHYLAASGLG